MKLNCNSQHLQKVSRYYDQLLQELRTQDPPSPTPAPLPALFKNKLLTAEEIILWSSNVHSPFTWNNVWLVKTKCELHVIEILLQQQQQKEKKPTRTPQKTEGNTRIPNSKWLCSMVTKKKKNLFGFPSKATRGAYECIFKLWTLHPTSSQKLRILTLL